ncbi:MAG: type II secretion system secretin GspD [Syntrophobacterales bacterium]|nr:type II secretion system secretin GspD [Syntrophobacterales bacterium]
MPSLNIIEERIAVARGRKSAGESLEGLRKREKSSSLLRPFSALLRQTRRMLPGGNTVANKSRYSELVAACVIFAALFVLLPGIAGAARIAGEEKPVTTTPAPAASAPPKAVVEKKAAAKAEKAVKTVAPASPVKAATGTPTVVAPPAPVTGSAQAPRTPASAIPTPVQSQERGPRFGEVPSPGVQPPASGVAASPANQPAAAGQASPAARQPVPVPDSQVQPPTNVGNAQPPSQASAPPALSGGAPAGSGRYVTIDFDNVDITVFIKFVSELTGRNFVVDDKVRGKVTVISPKKIAVSEVYKVFESVLDIYGFATVEAGEVIKVIPALEARGKNLELRLKRESIAPEDKIVTQILTLQHATPDDMKKVLDPLISKTSVVLSYPPAGMLIITDVLSNIKRLQEIVTALDVEGVGELISYVPLKFASAMEMAKSLTLIFQKHAVPGRAAISPVKVVADDRTNALIILAAENDMARIRELLNLMDKDIPRGAGMIRVYYLQNAKAEDLVKVLTGLPQQAKTAAGAPAAPAAAAAPISKNVQIVADKSTNSLIITADTADYLVLEDVIRKLDISRPMVYLEALIMEVNADKGFKLGVEWQGANSGSYRDRTGAIVGGVSGDSGSYSIAQNLVSGKGLPAGLSLGVVGQMINVATTTVAGVATTISFPNLAAFIQAYQSDTDFRFLSTPQLLTLDNEEAEITVGSNIPYVTRQDTTTTSTTNYSSYEYKDVGVTLKVTPQINKDGFIRMKLDQTVTKVDSKTADVGSGVNILAPTTLKRTAKTTVTVKDGETVVLGGMIEEESTKGNYKVPLLGDIPILGWLFKTRSNSARRTNLFVFITPRIIRTPEDAAAIQEDKKEYMKTIQEGTIKNTPAKKTGASASTGVIEVATPTGTSGNAAVQTGSGDSAAEEK